MSVRGKMKGIIFTEFLDIVEHQFGLQVCQQMLDDAGDQGSYTSVGSYDHRELVRLISSLSAITGHSVASLQELFGEAVFPRLLSNLPEMPAEQYHTLSFINRVEAHIHTEVKKLYPDANPPKFDFLSQTESTLIMDYKSARCMGHVCLGLIKGCAVHFGDRIAIEMMPVSGQQDHVRFKVERLTE